MCMKINRDISHTHVYTHVGTHTLVTHFTSTMYIECICDNVHVCISSSDQDGLTNNSRCDVGDIQRLLCSGNSTRLNMYTSVNMLVNNENNTCILSFKLSIQSNAHIYKMYAIFIEHFNTTRE